ncbi:acetyl-CoA hydrolase/transferase family protein [Corynebacterium sp.]|uniref:acetyl-CoA hydrolase/transferase family protein n=1 Tax=Corynebacterium sp. TaxID=1720 RepID=UPI0026DBADBD|nr:acetyl-CoA hydrolase/transferase family protein [Corynebacterium sp.]MDO4610078.1 acetyl-CoA hydrolase/transferase family protein [Corynebacterium sp.]
MSDRIAHAGLRTKVMTAQEAAAFINDGDMIGFAGFTGAGYPKVVPPALAERIKEAHDRGEEFKVGVLTGASTAPELDGALAEVDGVSWRMPYQSDPGMRKRINAGDAGYNDIHLSHSGPQTEAGFFGRIDVAVVEVTKIKEDGTLVPSSSVGNNCSYLKAAEKIILEVNSWQSEDLEGMHDIYSVGLPPHRLPIQINHPGDRIGSTTIEVDLDKVVAVVETDAEDRNSAFKPADEDSKKIAGYLLDFLDFEVKAGRLPENLLPMQSGVGNIPNAVLAGLLESNYENLTSFTEVIQDGMVDLIDAGKLTVASATAFSLSPEYAKRMNDNAKDYANKIILRPQDISNNPGVVRRLGLITTNGMIEADIYGNVNSTHVAGSRMMNGIGGSGDFTRNAYISTFVSPSVAKGGDISAIVPMVSHVDHTEHDVMVIITEQGLADLRGLPPRKRARVVIEKCAHPMYKEALLEYVERAEKATPFMHTPHDLGTAYDFHRRFLANGSMKPE